MTLPLGVKARAGFASILGLMYASACGGPYGTEDFVAKVGPGLFLLLLVVTPWIWGVPIALATAELSSRRPIAGGYYRWAQIYLGEFWGYQAGMWNLFTSFLDNALYPVLFANALSHLVPGLGAFQRWLAAVAFIVVLTYLNHRGIRVAGRSAVALNLFLVAPLVWLVLAAVPSARVSPFQPFAAPGADLAAGLALAMWLYSGYYEVSAAAEELDDPARNIPLSLLVLTPLIIASYALPTVAGLVAVGNWQDWTSGHFAAVGTRLGGPLLGHWLFLGNVASQAVVFLAYLVWWSRLVSAMASEGDLPKSLSRLHPRFGTPHRALWIYAAIYAGMAALPFESLLVADVWLTGVASALIFASLIRSRSMEPGTGFRIPGGSAGVWLCIALAVTTWLLLIVLSEREHVLLGTGAILAGPLLYAVTRGLRRLDRAPA